MIKEPQKTIKEKIEGCRCGHLKKYHQAIRFGDACTYGDCPCQRFSLLEDKPKHKYASCGNPLDCPECLSRPIEEQVIEKPQGYIPECLCDDKGVGWHSPDCDFYEEPKKSWETEFDKQITSDLFRFDSEFGDKEICKDNNALTQSATEYIDKIKSFITELLRTQKSELLKCLPKEKTINGLSSDYGRGYGDGFNVCRQQFLENIKK